jgi:hypothetical protein
MTTGDFLCSIVLLGGLWYSIDFLLPGRSLRDWRQKAKTLFGAFSMFWAGLSLYASAHPELRYSARANSFYSLRGFLAGMAIGTFICLGLTAKKVVEKDNPIA